MSKPRTTLPDGIKTQMVGLHAITVRSDRLRSLRQSVVDELAESIRMQGLLHPIVLRPQPRKNAGYILVAGWHRLEAVRKLGHEAIRAEIREGLNAELVEIDENLIRADLTLMERDLHVARRKVLYEELHPETRKGAAGRGERSRKLRHLSQQQHLLTRPPRRSASTAPQ